MISSLEFLLISLALLHLNPYTCISASNLPFPFAVFHFDFFLTPARDFDMGMKAIQNAKERDEDEWKKLFNSADPRYKFQGAMRVPNYDLAIIEVIWAG